MDIKKAIYHFFILMITISFLHSNSITRLVKDQSFTSGQLQNGFTYMIKENNHPEDRVYLYLYVKAGALNETSRQNGIAHFLEHLAYNGTQNFKAGAIDQFLESIGAPGGTHSNAYTSLDRTVYKLIIPTDNEKNIEKAFLILSEIAFKISFDQLEIEKERGVILEEMRSRKDLGTRINDSRRQLIYRQTKLIKHDIIGQKEKIEQFKRSDFLDFYQKWYQPNRMGLFVAGDISSAKMVHYIKQYFSTRKNSLLNLPDQQIQLPDLDQKYQYYYDQELDFGFIQVFFPLEKINNLTLNNRNKLRLLSIFEEIYSQRIEELLLQGNTDFMGSSVSSYWNHFSNKGHLIFTAQFNPEKYRAAYQLLNEQFFRLVKKSITPYELELIRTSRLQEIDHQIKELAKTKSAYYISQMMNAFSNQNLLISRHESLIESKKFFQKMKLMDVTDFISNHIKIINPGFFIALPPQYRDKISQEQLAQIYQQARQKQYEQFSYSGENEKIDLKDNPQKAGTILKRRNHKKLEFKMIQFKNGMKLLLKQTDFEPNTIYMRALLPQDVSFQKGYKMGYVNFYLDNLLFGGTKEWSAAKLNTFLNQKNIDFNFHGGFFNFSLDMSCPVDQLVPALNIFQKIITQPVFDEKIFNMLKEQKINLVSHSNKNPLYQFSIARIKNLLNLDPLNIEEIKQIKRQELVEIFQQTFNPQNMTYLIVGNFNVNEVIQQFALYLGNIPAQKAPQTSNIKVKSNLPREVKEFKIYKQTENKATLVLTFPGVHQAHPDVPYLSVITDILDERLDKKIREEDSKTYSIGINLNSMNQIKSGTIDLAFETDPATAQSTLGHVFDQLSLAKTRGFTQAELDRSITSIIKPFEEKIQSNGFWLDLIYNDGYGMPLDLQHKQIEKIKKIKLKQINQIIKKYLDLNQYFLYILYPEKMNPK